MSLCYGERLAEAGIEQQAWFNPDWRRPRDARHATGLGAQASTCEDVLQADLKGKSQTRAETWET